MVIENATRGGKKTTRRYLMDTGITVGRIIIKISGNSHLQILRKNYPEQLTLAEITVIIHLDMEWNSDLMAWAVYNSILFKVRHELV